MPKSNGQKSPTRKVAEIVVPKRHRKDMGDIPALAASVQDLGLLQPVAIDPDNNLLAGERRLAAFRFLERDTIPVHVVHGIEDLHRYIKTERDENVCRKDFTPSEAVALGQKLEVREAEEAEERAREGNARGGRGGKEVGDNLSPTLDGKTHGKASRKTQNMTRHRVAKSVGMRGTTYEKAKKVVQAAEQEPEVFGSVVEKMDQGGNVDAAYKEVQRIREEVAQEEAAAQIKEELAEAEHPDVRHCSVAELLPTLSGLDAIVTDPPYPQEFLSLYGELARLAKDALAPHGVLAVMCGQSYLPDILREMTAYLDYRWTFAYLTPGGQAVQLWDRKINTFWKPVLVFGAASSWAGDVVRSNVNDNDKQHHGWGQSESGMARLVEALTQPGQVVCDPFAGGGTTGVVCTRLGRRFVGCDIDVDCVEKTRSRMLLEAREQSNVCTDEAVV